MQITQELIDKYTKGGCGFLAFALNDITGWNVVGINGWAHWTVRTPDGFLLDITGLNTDEEMEKRWNTDDHWFGITDHEDAEELYESLTDEYMWGDGPQGMREAYQVARVVLDTYGLEQR